MQHRISLQEAIEIIRKRDSIQGTHSTEEEMAEKLSLSIQQFRFYLNGDEQPPEHLGRNLLTFYGFRGAWVEDRVTKYIKFPSDEFDDDQNQDEKDK